MEDCQAGLWVWTAKVGIHEFGNTENFPHPTWTEMGFHIHVSKVKVSISLYSLFRPFNVDGGRGERG